jgi:hypothetical protein
VVGHRYGNGIRDTACPTAMGNGELGQFIEKYSLAWTIGKFEMGQLKKGYSLT